MVGVMQGVSAVVVLALQNAKGQIKTLPIPVTEAQTSVPLVAAALPL